MLVTHLAMALTRTERGAPLLEDPPAVIVSEAHANPAELTFVRDRLDAYGAVLGEALPESELVFMTAHLCTVTLPE
jgi:PRD domain